MLSFKIDKPDQTLHLIEDLKAALPFEVLLTKHMRVTLRKEHPQLKLAARQTVEEVHYMGDEGGITCHLTGEPDAEAGVLVSITGVEIPPTSPLKKQVAAYQKHRVKKLRKRI